MRSRSNPDQAEALRSQHWRADREKEVVKGYEYQRGQFVTFTAEELKTLGE